jgi:UDP-glucose 4-epimerase
MLYGTAPIIFGDGSVTRDFFYVKDTATALSKLLDIKDLSGEIINIGTGEEITMKHLLEKIIEMMGSDLRINFMEDRPADVPRLWVNPAKFKRITGFNSAYSFEEGLKETINYYKELSAGRNLISEIAVKNWEK